MDEAGRSRGAMGVAWGDTKNGKGTALAIGNFSNELKSLYWTDAGDVFLDESPRSGVGPTSLLSLTFGLFFFDADLDGRLDLFLANGHVEPTVQQVQKDVAYREAPILYLNRGENRFAVAAAEGLAIALGRAGRRLSRTWTATETSTSSSSRTAARRASSSTASTDPSRASGSDSSGPERPTGTRRRARHRHGRRANPDPAGVGRPVLPLGPGEDADLRARRRRKIDRLEIRWPDGETETVTGICRAARRVTDRAGNAEP